MSNPELSPVLIDPPSDPQLSPEEVSFISSIHQKYNRLKVGDLLIFAGDQHFYQYFCLIAMFITGVIEGLYKFIIPYLFYNVSFKCLNDNGVFVPCTEEVACSGSTKFEVTSHIFSLNQNFNLYCEDQIYATYSAFMVVAGGGCFAFLLVFITDIFGRKTCFLFGVAIHIFSISIVYIARSSLILTVAALTLNMATVFLWYSNVTLFLNESLGSITRLISMPSIMVARSFGIISAAALNYFVPNYLYACAINMVILASIAPCYFFMEETLFYQYQKGTLGGVYSSAKKICGINFGGSEKEQRRNYIFKMLFSLKHSSDSIIGQLEDHKGLPLEQSKLESKRMIFLEEQLVSSLSSVSVNYSQEDLNKSEKFRKRISDRNHLIVSNIEFDPEPNGKTEQTEPQLSGYLVDRIKEISTTQDVAANQKKTKKSYSNILQLKYFFRLIGAIFICSTDMTANGLTAYSIQSLGFKSIYIAGISMGVFDIIGGLSSIWGSSVMTSKNVIVCGQLTYFLASSLLMGMYYFKEHLVQNYLSEEYINIVGIIASFALRFGVSFSQGVAYSYTTELFPTHLRALAFGISFTFARIGMGASELFIHWFNRIGFNPNAAILFLAVFAFPISIFMPTTEIKMSN